MRNLYLLISFLVLAPLVLITNIILLLYFSYQKNQPYAYINALPKQSVAYAALPTIQNISHGEIIQEDARVEMVRQFFAKYNSPLEPFAQDVIYQADLYGLDFRLIPAIAMQESNLCLKAPPDSNNCWGFGIYGKQVQKFSSYSEGIAQVTKTLATVYKKNGLEKPEEIMTKYTPSSNGSWAYGVNHFMNQLQ